VRDVHEASLFREFSLSSRGCWLGAYVVVDHSSINRWAIRFLPLLEKAFRKHKRAVGASWRMDETYIKVKGVWKYLYRAVDKEGKTVDFLLTARLGATRPRPCGSSKKP
jgi:transposase-like protein